VDPSGQVLVHQEACGQSEREMDEFGGDIILEIQWDHVQQIYIHGVIGKFQGGYFIYAAMLDVQLWNIEMMGQCIPAYRRNTCQ